MTSSSRERTLIENFRKEKYSIDPKTGACNITAAVKNDYHNLLKTIAEQLYSKDIHFVFELIQNAEDNDYPMGTGATLSFELLDHDPTETLGSYGCLVIRNNELGFNIENIQAISSVGQSTKANRKETGYIGEKGIGFKSVFAVSSSPHILSNGFRIKFLKRDEKTDLGYIVPYWLEETIPELGEDNDTVILLPLEEKHHSGRRAYDVVLDELSRLKPEIILFLKKITCLNVQTKRFRTEYAAERDGEKVLLTSNIDGTEHHQSFLVRKKQVVVPDAVESELRKGVGSREIAVALPVGHRLQVSKLYCYLPTELSTGLPFLINADFILNASRESIRYDLAWNQWMRNEVALASYEALANYLESSESEEDLNWIPIWSDGMEKFWETVFKVSRESLPKHRIVPVSDGSKVSFKEALLVKRHTDLVKGLPAFSIERFEKKVCLVAAKNRAGLEHLGLREFSDQNFVELISAIKPEDELDKKVVVNIISELTSSQQNSPSTFKYSRQKAILVSANLFYCEGRLRNAAHKNIFRPSSEEHEVPVVESLSGESTRPGFLDADFYHLIPASVRANLGLFFGIYEVDTDSYLRDSVLPFIRKHKGECTPGSLESLVRYVIANIDIIPDPIIDALRVNLPVKTLNGMWTHLENDQSVVVPNGYDEDPLWPYIFTSATEKSKILVLHDDYLTWGDDDEIESFFAAFEISDFVSPLIARQSDSKNGIVAGRPLTPYVFLASPTSLWLDPDHRDRAIYWLSKVYEEEEKLSPANGSSERMLDYFLLKFNWLLSTEKGLCKPDPSIHNFSEKDRNIFGSALNYTVQPLPVSLAKLIGLTIEPTPKGFMDQLVRIKNMASIDVSNITNSYAALEKWSVHDDNIRTRLSRERLIYLPRSANQWCSLEEVTWQSDGDMGDAFIGLSSYLPEGLAHYFVNRLQVRHNHYQRAYFEAYIALSSNKATLDAKGRLRLNKLVRGIIELLKNDTDVQIHSLLQNFKKTCLLPTSKSQWLSVEKNLYVSDDGDMDKLFQSNTGAHFTWSNSSEFQRFFEEMGVKKLSQHLTAEVLGASNLVMLDQGMKCVTIFAMKMIADYFSNNTELTPQSMNKIKELAGAPQFSSELINVRYRLGSGAFEDVLDKTAVYDDTNQRIVIKEGAQSDDIKDDLAESLSRFLFGSRFKIHEDTVLRFLEIRNQDRLDKLESKYAISPSEEWQHFIESLFTNDSLYEEVADETEVPSPIEESNDGFSGINSPEEEFFPVCIEDVEEIFNELDDPEIKFSDDNSPDYTGTEDFDSENFSESETSISIEDEYDSPVFQSHSQRTADSQRNYIPGSSTSSRPKNRSNHTSQSSATPSNSPGYGYRLLSYVEKEGSHGSSEESDRIDESDSQSLAIGNAAELLVKEMFEKLGYEVSLLGGTNPGYDIELLDPSGGEIIFVEVKGQVGTWNRTGVSMSSVQMAKCRQEGANYWLVVVEHLMTSPRVYKLVNPSAQIDRYFFDGNWSVVAERIGDVVSTSSIEIEDLLSDENCVAVFKRIRYLNVMDPEVGFEVSNDKFEVIAELELAWPDIRRGVSIDPEVCEIQGWDVVSIDSLLSDDSWLRLLPAKAD